MVAFGHVAEIYVVDVCEGVAHQLFLFFFFFLRDFTGSRKKFS